MKALMAQIKEIGSASTATASDESEVHGIGRSTAMWKATRNHHINLPRKCSLHIISTAKMEGYSQATLGFERPMMMHVLHDIIVNP
jgi:hypothetical protein